MAVTPAGFKIRFPQFVAEDDTRIQLFLDKAEIEISEDCWGDMYEEGVYQLAAHFLVLDKQQQEDAADGITDFAAGPLTSKTVDKVTLSFGVPAGGGSNGGTSDALLMTTPYGAEYVRMRALIPGGALVV